MENRNISLYIDIAFCLVLLPAMIMLVPIDKWLNSDPDFVIMLLGWLYTIYIVHRTITVPAMFGESRRPILALLLLVASLAVTYILARYQLTPPPDVVSASGGFAGVGRMRMLQQAVWFLYLLVTSFSVIVALFSELYRQSVMRQEIEFERKRAELSLYKAQINPHFLFNTLNTIFGLVVTKSDKAEDAIVQFTSLMRYMCNNSTQEYVPLYTEMEYIEEYIVLQRYRLSDHTKVDFTTSVDSASEGSQIAPMLLITFVENAIKYGASSQFKSDVEIKLEVVDGVIELTTRNPIFAAQSNEQGAGIGILNCRKRLELLYPNRYTLQIIESESHYEAHLTIKLQA